MKNNILLTLALAMVWPAAGAWSAPAPAMAYQFADNSLLANGKWVRVEVPETGVYEITYRQLREMGFSDPSKVAVYGHGGSNLSINFLNARGSKIFQDNPVQIRVMHTDSKLIFYGIGPEDMTASTIGSGDDEKIKFDRTSRNIYNESSSYLLSDTYPVETVSAQTVDDKSDAALRETGFACHYHEKDVRQASDGTGQHFWGESFAYGQPVSFHITQPYCVDKPVYINSTIALDANSSGNLTIKFNNIGRSFPTSISAPAFKNFGADNSDMKFTIDDSGKGTALLRFVIDRNYPSGSLLALDWWTVSAPVSLSLADASTFSQQYLAFPVSSGTWKHSLPEGAVAWDVTGRAQPTALDTSDGFFYSQSQVTTEIVVFNPGSELKHVKSWNSVANQNLHALYNEGADLVIFTTDVMLPHARQIAALHEEYEGQKTVVVTPEEIYNEFNCGARDPMAYRALVKMLYQSPGHKVRNVLFLGRVSADVRNIKKADDIGEPLIGYQKIDNNLSTEAPCIMDYYGIITDYLQYTENLTNAPISVGIGNLPVNSVEEASNVVAKIKEYLEKEDFSNVVNETMTMSYKGDNYLHDMQAADYANIMQSYMSDITGSEFSHKQIRVDEFGNQLSAKQNIDAIDRGKFFSLYFGHAIQYGLGKTETCFSANELMNLNNNELSFYFMAACDLCMPDKGVQGFGDIGVTRSRRGFIGTVCSTRPVMSNDNESLAKSFLRAMFYDSSNRLRTQSPTMGEIFAQSKNVESSNSELAFLLIGDPALRLPVPLGKVELDLPSVYMHPGQTAKINGKVLGADGTVNTSYNGFVTVKLHAPARRVVLPVRASSSTDSISSYNTDRRLVAVKGEVRNGEFSVSLPIPQSSDEFMSAAGSPQSLTVMAGTYDPSLRLGCAGSAKLAMAVDGSEPDPSAETDGNAPVLTLTYDDMAQTISVQATDDVALMPGIGDAYGVSLMIGDNSCSIPSDESNDVSVTNYTANVSTAALEPGEYTAKAVARDVAGNRSETKTINFTVTPASPLSLTADTEVAVDNITFSVNNPGADALTLIITDLDGKVLMQTDSTESRMECDLSDFEAGIYRAAVRHDSAKGARLYSNWIEFTVID